jgi:hypothetical protein
MQKSYSARRAKNQLPDRAKAERTARHMVAKAFEEGADLHLHDAPDYGAPEEVTFTRSQEAEAIAWTAAKLMAGAAIFRRAGPPRPRATEHLDHDFHS